MYFVIGEAFDLGVGFQVYLIIVAAANLALSVSRAEAVVDALILRGINPGRLYAIGYGESLPIASNDTRAGKQANRRIAFTLSDE